MNATTGVHIWNYTLTTLSRAASSPAVIDGVVYIGSWDDPQSRVFALNAMTGAQIWNSTAGIRVYSSPVVSGGVVYVGSLDSNVYAFDASTGAQIWNYTTGDQVHSSPAVSGGIVYVGSDDSAVYALNATTGAHIWSRAGGDYSCPAVSGGFVYVGSYDGKVYAFTASVPDFSIVAQQTSDTVIQGESTTVAVTITSIHGYSEIVTLSASGQPTGVSVSFDPETGAPNFNSDMNISVGQDVEPDTYAITITGAGADEKVHTTIFELTVTGKTQSLLELLAPWIILLIIVIIIIIILIIWKWR